MAQFCYLLLYALGVLAALVQRGHPMLVLGILAALLPLALLARLPRRWFPGWLRQVLQILIAGCGVAWWRLRTGGAPVDTTVVESAALIGSALALGGVPREYGLLGVISLILLGYGGLTPGRALYLPVLCLYLAVGIVLMYETRTANLAQAPGAGEEGDLSPRYRANWGYRLAHLAAVCALTLLLVAMFPMPQGRSVGLIPVGFPTTQDLAFPMLWRQWLQPATGLFGRGETSSRAKATDRGEGDLELSRDPTGARTVPAETPGPSLDGRNGSGTSAGVGTDLVMRVRSAAKLYWLVQAYDLYDGDSWQVSAMLREGRNALDRGVTNGPRRLEQEFSIVKPASHRLPGAFRLVQCVWDAEAPTAAALADRRPPIRVDGAGAWIVGERPALPWQYRAVSQVPTLDAKPLPAAAVPSGREGATYRRLPEGRIPERVRRLATGLTEDCETPLAKAMALQEHLRRHYTYSLTPPPIPSSAEPVDFFLFESREGYCQHFAQALTVLARCVGLPARLATGYSPGNHNLLSNCFEVYEYHAHAWTQIDIEPYGWLTFDGVAPANLRIEAGPSLLRPLMDPFPESWSAHPPELSVPTAAGGRAELHTSPRNPVRGPIARALEDIYGRAMHDDRTKQPSGPALVRAAGAMLWEWLAAQRQRLSAALAEWASHAASVAWAAARAGGHLLRGLSVATYLGVGAAIVLLGVLWGRRRLVLAMGVTACQRWLCRRRWRQLDRARHEGEPVVLVRAGCELLRQAMALGRFARPTNLDAEEYAGWLQTSEPRIGADYRQVAQVMQRMVFRDIPPTRTDANTVLDAVGRIRQEIADRLTLAGTRRRAAAAQPEDSQAAASSP